VALERTQQLDTIQHSAIQQAMHWLAVKEYYKHPSTPCQTVLLSLVQHTKHQPAVACEAVRCHGT
jgi:hypothetical protein